MLAIEGAGVSGMEVDNGGGCIFSSLSDAATDSQSLAAPLSLLATLGLPWRTLTLTLGVLELLTPILVFLPTACASKFEGPCFASTLYT